MSPEQIVKESSSKSKSFFETKLRPALIYVGTIGAAIMVVAYIILVCVLVFGFKADLDLTSAIVFALANAITGLLVMFFLKIQGESFAKNLPENKPIVNDYYHNDTKDKKIHSMLYFWVTSTLKDIFIKAVCFAGSIFAIVKIIINGNGDLALIGLAIVNILMFICFGFLSLVKAYDFYNEHHVPYMKKQLKLAGKELKIVPENDIIINEEREEESHD